MEFTELLGWIEFQNNRLIKLYGEGLSQNEWVLSRNVKLMEELGELCEEVLSSMGNQRQDKLDKYTKENLSAEFADVLITTLLLAQSMNIDVREALRNKIEKINERFASLKKVN